VAAVTLSSEVAPVKKATCPTSWPGARMRRGRRVAELSATLPSAAASAAAVAASLAALLDWRTRRRRGLLARPPLPSSCRSC